jgi:hypothetical protein
MYFKKNALVAGIPNFLRIGALIVADTNRHPTGQNRPFLLDELNRMPFPKKASIFI